jgi:hypothetical protein
VLGTVEVLDANAGSSRHACDWVQQCQKTEMVPHGAECSLSHRSLPKDEKFSGGVALWSRDRSIGDRHCGLGSSKRV